ncbi:hypothetical protein J4402_02500 [Candidatus Pacearchaeota archaeon]|nr:hypothetical protein [Candidatus Pacearchaeota archaeon]
MSLFSSSENRVKCGKCGTEFDLNKNQDSCPLCGFGRSQPIDILSNKEFQQEESSHEKDLLSIPPQLKLSKGNINAGGGRNKIGSWGMFNDYFSGKFLLRINANLMHEKKVEFVSLHELIENAKVIISKRGLKKMKGFPNDIKTESSVNRLVNHFLVEFYNMGLFDVQSKSPIKKKSIWNESWENILVRPTSEGLEFAKLKNKIFDEKAAPIKDNQILTNEERQWLINYLKNIEKYNFKEYSLLKEIASFIQKGNNGNNDLREWFKKNPIFVSYVKEWSSKSDDDKEFEKQLSNLSQTYGSGKISLLRELGVISNKRNDYKVIGELK